jgi:hypothetical protein
MKRIDQQALEAYQLKSREIQAATAYLPEETSGEREARLRRCKKDYNYFVIYYFPHYAKGECGKFQIDFANAVLKLKNGCNMFAAEWARGHAKSVHADIFIPLWLMLNGELGGMVLIGKSFAAAKKLLGDVQNELAHNNRFIADYGEQISYGDWAEGEFTTREGINFVAGGLGSPIRGSRKGAKRPTYAVLDDIDDDEMCRNQSRVLNTLDWIFEALHPALEVDNWRIVMANNRIAKNSILAHFVGDVTPNKPKRAGLYHSKVNAFNDKGEPSWSEYYTKEALNKKIGAMPYKSAQKEYYNNPITEGRVFKADWIRWTKAIPAHKHDFVLCYIDPSWKESSKNDFKAARLMGTIGTTRRHLRAFCRQESMTKLVAWCYDTYDELVLNAKNPCALEFFIEANFMQDTFLDDFKKEGDNRGYQLPIRGDYRKKPDKGARIEVMASSYECGFVEYDNSQDNNTDMLLAIEHTCLFEQGSKTPDDAPDAEEGGAFMLNKRSRVETFERRVGKRQTSKNNY